MYVYLYVKTVKKQRENVTTRDEIIFREAKAFGLEVLQSFLLLKLHYYSKELFRTPSLFWLYFSYINTFASSRAFKRNYFRYLKKKT